MVGNLIRLSSIKKQTNSIFKLIKKHVSEVSMEKNDFPFHIS